MRYTENVRDLVNMFGVTASLESVTFDVTSTSAYGDPDVTYTTSSINVYIEPLGQTDAEEWKGFGRVTIDDLTGIVPSDVTINVGDILDITSTGRRYEVLGKKNVVLAKNSQFTIFLLSYLVE